MRVLAFDTSNYTTSVASFDGTAGHDISRLLDVEQGALGLRQSDALFAHVKRLPELADRLFSDIGTDAGFEAVGVSTRPRAVEGSYMPCFLAGESQARVLGAALGVPVLPFSHQQGHIAAALYSVNRLDLLHERFLAFHMSGGTTEAVLVEPVEGDKMFRTRLVASSLDLKAGQVIDRIGVMLGLPFPAGKHLDPIACNYTERLRVRASMKGANCSLSGVENKCRELMKKGAPKEEIAATCMAYVIAASDAMCKALIETFGDLPVVFSGGVSSNSMLRAHMSEKYGALLAEPRFSADNAAGIAVLASLSQEA